MSLAPPRRLAIASGTVVVLSLVVFVAVRLAAIALIPVAPTYDCVWYYDRAVALSEGLGYVDAGQPTAFWPPGYPAFLGMVFAIAGAHVWVGQVANVALGVAICLLTYHLALAMFEDRAGAALSVALLALYPNQIGYSLALSTEIFYSFLIVLAVTILSLGINRVTLTAFGIILGCATLTKTQTLFLPLAIIIATTGDFSWAALRSYGRRIALVYAALAVVILPWMVRNDIELGHFVLASNGGITLLTGNNPSANGDYTVDDDLVRQAGETVWQATGEAQFAADRRARDLALAWVRENPWRFLSLMPKKIWRLWAVDGETEWGFQAGYPDYARSAVSFRVARWINQAYYGLLVVGGIIAIGVLWRQRRLFRNLGAAGVMIAAYTTAITVVFSGQSRFHHFLMPWIVAYAGWLLAEAWRRARHPMPSDSTVSTQLEG